MSGVMQKMAKQMQKMKQEFDKAQEELSKKIIVGSAGGGAVVAEVNGNGDLISVKISKEAVDPDDVETLEDLVLAAINQASQEAKASSEKQIGSLIPSAGGLGF